MSHNQDTPIDMILPLDSVAQLVQKVLMREGCDEANAQAVAEVLWKAERDGSSSHGLFRLPGYIASLRSGKVNGKAKPFVSNLSPGVLRVDGDGGYAPLAHKVMLEPLLERAKSQGVAIAALVNTYHFAALWVEVEMLAERGVVALACTSYKPAMPPASGIKPLFGTNPIAFGWPREGKEPLVFDQASSVVARGEVMIAARDGKKMPEGVGIGPDGTPTTDPNEILKGAILPSGGYKGASLALMVELLAGPLLGECLSFEAVKRDNDDGGPPQGGEFILAIAPSQTGASSNFQTHAELLFAEMLSQPGVRLPSDRRRARRAAVAKTGVRVPANIQKLLGVD